MECISRKKIGQKNLANGTDNANVMVGINNGDLKKLRASLVIWVVKILKHVQRLIECPHSSVVGDRMLLAAFVSFPQIMQITIQNGGLRRN